MKHGLWCVAVIAGLCALSEGADWYQWRGPERDGIVADSPPLLDQFNQADPKELWTSEKIPGRDDGGYGSVTVADGMAYVYCNWKYHKPLKTRTLSGRDLKGRLGWSAEMPAGLLKKLEEARVSPERANLGRAEVRGWVNNWVRTNVSREHRRFRGMCSTRLNAGPRAIPTEILTRLEAIKDKEFASQNDLDTWFDENEVEERWRKAIQRCIPTRTAHAYDKVFCLDAASGRTIWQVELPGRAYGYSCSSTPCVVGGRCYVEGSDANVYCFDAKTGAEIWKAKSKIRPATLVASSFVVQDGVAILLAGVLTGFDPDTGEILWTQDQIKGEHASATYWRTGGKTYLVCNGKRETSCFDPKTGEVLWSVPGGGWSTPAIAGDHMVVFSNQKKVGLVGYRLSLGKAEQLWAMEFKDRGASPVIYDGYVYAIGGRTSGYAKCIHVESGKVAWDEKLPNTEIASPVVADGKLFIVVGMGAKTALYMIKATPEKYTFLGKTELKPVTCTSPALVDGKVYLRLSGAIACYDLRK